MNASASRSGQTNLFQAPLRYMLNPAHPLLLLAEAMDWDQLDRSFRAYLKAVGWPTGPIRVLVSLYLLKELYQLNDPALFRQWTENPYFQHFSGQDEFHWQPPLPLADFVHFQQWLGEKGRVHLQQTLARAKRESLPPNASKLFSASPEP